MSGFLTTPAKLWQVPFSVPFSRGKGNRPPQCLRPVAREATPPTRCVREKLVRLPQPPSNTKANRAGHSKVQRAIWQHRNILLQRPSSKKIWPTWPLKAKWRTSGLRLGSEGREAAFSSLSGLPKRPPFFLTAWTKRGSKKRRMGPEIRCVGPLFVSRGFLIWGPWPQ